MREEGGLWLENQKAGETAEGLALLEESQGLLRNILLGVALQYRSLEMERKALLGCPEPGPDPVSVQAAASLVTLCALFGFQRQAEYLARREAGAGGTPDMMDVKLGANGILITIIRLLRLVSRNGGRESAEDIDDPVV